jgi:hypothetical protein
MGEVFSIVVDGNHTYWNGREVQIPAGTGRHHVEVIF